jgi:hypothetical protein
MSEHPFDRIQGDLATMRRAMGLRLPFGKEVLIFGLLSSVTAAGAAAVSLVFENDWVQIIPCAAFAVVCFLGLYVESRGAADLSHEIKLQVGFSITTNLAVFGAACGYAWWLPAAGTSEFCEPRGYMPRVSSTFSPFCSSWS